MDEVQAASAQKETWSLQSFAARSESTIRKVQCFIVGMLFLVTATMFGLVKGYGPNTILFVMIGSTLIAPFFYDFIAIVFKKDK